MNEEKRFQQYSERLRAMFPTWSAIRKDPESVGAQFLSAVGINLDEVEWMLGYAYEQVYIQTADVTHIDLVYKARIPNSLTPNMNYRIQGGSHVLIQEVSELSFIEGIKSGGAHASLQHDISCYVDFEKKSVYVKQAFGKSDAYPNGCLTLTVYNEQFPDEEPVFEQLPLTYSPVWNFFDEFGLLMGVSRLEGERNAPYKERILDVFRRPSSAAKTGLINGIARGLGLIRQLNWKDSSRELIIRQPRVDIDSIRVDGESVPAGYLGENTDGCIVIAPYPEGGEREVRYIAGVNLHELHDTEDTELQKRLYDIDGDATPLLTYYVESIRRKVPIMWGEWRWNQGTWEAGDAGYSGFNALPTLLDGNFSGWVKEEGTTWR